MKARPIRKRTREGDTCTCDKLEEMAFCFIVSEYGHQGRLAQRQGEHLVLLSSGATRIGDYFDGIKDGSLLVKKISKEDATAIILAMSPNDRSEAREFIK